MIFSVSPACVELGLRAAAIVLRGVHVGPSQQPLRDLAIEAVAHVRTRFVDAAALRTAPEIAALHLLFRNLGINPRRVQPAAQRLAQMALSRGTLPEINNLVDAYNIVSVHSLCCLGAHDMKHVALPVTLQILTGAEAFLPLGASVPELVQAGEFGYVDANGQVLCRLDIVQAEHTKVSEEATDVLVIIESTTAHPRGTLDAAIRQVIELTTRFCGGHAEVAFQLG